MSKDDCKCKRGKRGKRGHRGHRGRQGQSGNSVLSYVNGTVLITNSSQDSAFIGNVIGNPKNYELAGNLANSVDITSGKFTVPTDGIYSVSYSAAFTEASTGSPNGERLIDLVVNDAESNTAQYASVNKVESALNRVPISLLTIATDLPMKANETINLFVYYNMVDPLVSLESITITFMITQLSSKLPTDKSINKKIKSTNKPLNLLSKKN